MKFKLVEKIIPYRGNNDRANYIADELYYGDVKELKRMRDKLRKDIGFSKLNIYVVENDNHTYDIYEDLELIEDDFQNWEDVVNYCKFLDHGWISFEPSNRIPSIGKSRRDEAIVYNNDKFIEALKQLITDKVNIIRYLPPESDSDIDNNLLTLWKDGMKASDIIKKYHLDEKYEKIPGDESSGVIPTARWANSRYQGGVSYNDWSGDSPFDEYGEVYEDLDMKDLDDEIQISREY